MKLLCLDPGTTQTGLVVLEVPDFRIVTSKIIENDEFRDYIPHVDDIAIEMIASYGRPVGKEVFETILWIGRMCEYWKIHHGTEAKLIFRRDVKLWLCGTHMVGDASVRQALLDKFGPQGTKASPGPLYGVKSHAWSALAVGVCALQI